MAFVKPFEAPKEVWKWKYKLIFILLQLSEMQVERRVNNPFLMQMVQNKFTN